MRSLSLSGLFILVCYLSNAQSNTFPSTGSVGIGTLSPIAKLDIRGSGDLFNLGSRSGSFYLYVNEFATLVSVAPTDVSNWSGIVMTGSSDVSGRLGLVLDYGKPALGFGPGNANRDVFITRESGHLAFRFGSTPTEKVRITNSGNVGIGTTAPDSKLTVKGVIHAEEVKVDLAVPGPDYVFDESYPLRSLEDTKTYIDQNKHLPGIPSSDEMQQNGVNLLEMNMKLLEKVEELTLHLIEMKRENEEQKQLNIKQQQQLEALLAKTSR